MILSDRINETLAFIHSQTEVQPEVGIVLGTGLGGFAKELDILLEIPYEKIPHFPKSTVKGHDGKLLIAEVSGKKILAMKGRFHFYEGYTMEQVTFPIRVMKALKVNSLLLSNASGGMNPEFRIGDIMMINDHINLFPTNPLIGPNEDNLGPRFPDMSEPYDSGYRELMRDAALESGVGIKEGVYAGLTGPCFETPAEYRYLRIIGADNVGMSTVPETIVARHCGMKVAALSIITDLGIEGTIEPITHEEVQAAAAETEPKLAMLIKSFLSKI